MKKTIFNIRKYLNMLTILIVYTITGSLFIDSLKSEQHILARLQQTEVRVVRPPDDYTAPLVTFTIDDLTYTNYADGYEFEKVNPGDLITVFYDPHNPNRITSKESLDFSIKVDKAAIVINVVMVIYILWQISKYKYKHYELDKQPKPPKYPNDLDE